MSPGEPGSRTLGRAQTLRSCGFVCGCCASVCVGVMHWCEARARGVNGCIVGRMPKMQVYLPDELYEKIKSQTTRLNVSGILQDALAQRLDQLERLDALAAAVDSYTAEFGAFSDEELNRQIEADKKQMARPRTKKKAPSAA